MFCRYLRQTHKMFNMSRQNCLRITREKTSIWILLCGGSGGGKAGVRPSKIPHFMQFSQEDAAIWSNHQGWVLCHHPPYIHSGLRFNFYQNILEICLLFWNKVLGTAIHFILYTKHLTKIAIWNESWNNHILINYESPNRRHSQLLYWILFK